VSTGGIVTSPTMSTRRLVILAMICGIAIIVAFAAQLWLASK